MTEKYFSSIRFYSFTKRWKKRLRHLRRLRWICLSVMIFVMMGILSVYWLNQGNHITTKHHKDLAINSIHSLQTDTTKWNEANQMVLSQLLNKGKKYEVIMHKQYICGGHKQSRGLKTAIDIKHFIRNHPDWQVQLDQKGRVICKQQVEQFEMSCKHRAHISVDEDENLVLYDGKPKQRQVIRIFFQLDMKTMESSLSPRVLQQLYEGILITDLDAYDSVLSTFSDYAIEETQKVMKPTAMNKRIIKEKYKK